MNKIILLIPLLLLTPTFVYAHENYSNSKGCMRTDKIDSYWFDNVCKHIPLPRLVATTGPGSCINGTCTSGDWIPNQK